MAARILQRSIVVNHKYLLNQTKRHGYIVLVPETTGEIPEKHSMSRVDEAFPNFEDLNGQQCISALGKLTLEYETGFWKLEDKVKNCDEPLQYKEIVGDLEALSLPLDAAWGVLKTLSVVQSKQIKPDTYSTVHERARRARAKRFNSPSIYKFMKTLSGQKDFDEEQKRTVNKFLLEGRLNGLDLEKSDYQTFMQILSNIGQERAKYRGKLEVATTNFKQIIGDSSLVRDYPQELLMATANDRSKYALGPWTITLNPTISNQFMQYCPMRELRWNIWQATVRRCSNEGEKSLNNSTHIETLRSLRRDQAKLLGFNTFAHMSMETKMAGSLETIQAMITTLLLKARDAQEVEMKLLHDFAVERGFEGTLQAWDIPYWKRKQQRTLFEMSEADMKPYFPLNRVLEGLFQLIEKLFQVEVVQDMHSSTWDPDVSFYHIRNLEGKLIGGFYLDPFARNETKLSSAPGWMIGLRGRNMAAADGGLPLAALIFNFQPGTPCCISHLEIIHLFQKFGHMLQHVLASAHCSEVAGLNNVEWDAVNISSELLTLWLQHIPTLKSLSGHFENGEPLPEKQLLSLASVHKHMAGYELCKELYLSALDLELHTSGDFWLDVVKKLYPKYSPFELDKRDAHPCSFSAIFSGDWAAAYYSNLWAKMVAADVFSAFMERPDDVDVVGKRFRQEFLEPGGSCHPATAFRKFRGRDPSPNALLKYLGLKK